MSLTSGARLGPYEVIAPLGAGGMGEVYKARDTRLDRIVAVKVLPAALAEDPEFRHRFDREARTISQLSHPHICTLFDVGDGFLVMEYLEGETLAERLARGALPVNEAVRIASQIADALDKAHHAGIVHRDLKPGNVMLTRSGAKLLDFGLAKPGVTHGFQSRTAAGATLASMPTMTTPPNLTGQGAVLGTLQYMAPEVLEGAEADARSDIFAFGCVLYEMLTGKRAFQGKSEVSLIGAILKDNPTAITAREGLPPALIWLVGRCLAKNPDDRRQTAAGLVSQLEWIMEGGGEAAASVAPRRSAARGFILAAGAAFAVAGATGGLVWWYLRPAAPPVRTTRFVMPLAADEIVPAGSGSRNVAISPDGSQVVYITRRGVGASMWLRRLEQLEPIRLTDPALTTSAPAISPDGKWVAFMEGSNIQKVATTGGPAVMVAQRGGGVGAVGITWSDNDTIVFATGDPTTGLQMVSASGGALTVLTKPDRSKGEEDHTLPSALPDGHAVLFTVTTGAGSYQVAVLDVVSGSYKTLIPAASSATYVPTGHLIYAAADGLRAVRFDAERLEVVGEPVLIVDSSMWRVGGAADFAVSQTGTLVYVPAGIDAVTEMRTAVWVDRQGREVPIDGLPLRAYLMGRVSPDGSRIAFDIRDQTSDIWTWDIRYRTLAMVTRDPAQDMFPVWHPDGNRIIFSSTRRGAPTLYLQAADGSGEAERLLDGPRNRLPLTIDRDGKLLVFRDNDGRRAGPDLGVLSIETRTDSVLLGAGDYAEDNASISPDGRWIAYESTESGRREVYVRPFPNVDSGRIPISATGGGKPLWAPGGRELFYLDGSGHIVSVPVQTTDAFTRGAAVQLFPAPYYFTQARNFDISRDGQRFLMLKNPSNAGAERPPVVIHVVLDWFEELKQRVAN